MPRLHQAPVAPGNAQPRRYATARRTAALILLLAGLLLAARATASTCPSGYTIDPFVAGVCYDCPSGWDRYLLQPDPTASNACTRNRGWQYRSASTYSADCTTVLGVTVCTCDSVLHGRSGSTCYKCDSPYAKNITRSWTSSQACEYNPPREYTNASVALADLDCGGLDERACLLTERPLAACDDGLVELLNTSGAYCRRILGDGYPNHCGREGQPACQLTEHIPSCTNLLVEQSGTCIHPDCGRLDERACLVTERIPSCDTGLVELLNTSGAFCREILADGFPNHCGRDGQPPCQVGEHVPSCQGDGFEWLVADASGAQLQCVIPDADGYPSFCGDDGEPACNVALQAQLLILACKPGNANEDGTCRALDGDGYPTFCGDPDEPACTADQQLLFGIEDCKNDAYNDLIFSDNPFGTCRALDADGYPANCGGISETPCDLEDQARLGITSCKTKLEENFALGLCIDACGGHGLPACLVGACDSGLSVQGNDNIDGQEVCGAAPRDWGESDADELPPRGPRVVFFIHGRGGELGDAADAAAILKHLAFNASNVAELYGVDWNNTVRAPTDLTARRVTLKRLTGSYGAPAWHTVKTYGRRAFNNRTHTIIDTAQAIAEAIRDIAPDEPVTILTHSYGGVIARQLVYRHYDQLRDAGHVIAEVVTVKGPHTGGLVGTPDFIGEFGGLTRNGLGALTDFACTVGRLGDLAGAGAGQDGCQLGAWVDWSQRNAPISIDDAGYPQIRWVSVAGSGYRIDKGAIDAALNSGLLVDPFLRDILEDAKDTSHVPFQDSDETVSTRSAFGIGLDACFPYTRATPPGSSASAATVVPDQATWDMAVEGETVAQSADSATCYHASGDLPAWNIRERNGHGFASGMREEAFVFSAIATALPAEDADGDNLLDAHHDNCPDIANPDLRDTDGDEQGDACDPDDDNDGLLDTFEDDYGYNPLAGGEQHSDEDEDGLTALQEQNAGTNPTLADSDGDGFDDATELALGTDPNDPNSAPSKPIPTLPWPGLLALAAGLVLLRRAPRRLPRG